MNAKHLGVVTNFKNYLPSGLADHAVNLGEGNTPLLKLRNLPNEHNLDIEIWVKFEGNNPTGSFKDRGMAVAVSSALMRGAKGVICASTGNTSASAAAYAAAANLACVVLLPANKVAAGKIAQASAHGALCLMLEENFDVAMQTVIDNKLDSIEIVNSINPMRLQGQKTIAFEVVEQLGKAPDIHALPVGNAGNITAHWIGYSELANTNTNSCNLCNNDCQYLTTKISKRPMLLGVQAEGAAPFLKGGPVEQPDTVATAIRIGNPQSWDLAKHAIEESNGQFTAVSDEQILKTQLELASKEGVFCEPASATSVAGVINHAKAGKIDAGSVVVCTLTGHGLKDPDIVKDAGKFKAVDNLNQVSQILENL